MRVTTKPVFQSPWDGFCFIQTDEGLEGWVIPEKAIAVFCGKAVYDGGYIVSIEKVHTFDDYNPKYRWVEWHISDAPVHVSKSDDVIIARDEEGARFMIGILE